MKTTPAHHRRAVFEALARLGTALSAAPRLEILEVLAQGRRTVEEVSTAIDQSVANTSHHLKVLRAAGLVRAEKDGRTVWCEVADADVVALLVTMQRIGEAHLSGVSDLLDGYLHAHGALESVDAEALLQRQATGQLLLVDVRSEREFQAGHLPGAVSIPFDQLRARLSELPNDQQVVAYCRGRTCVMAAEAVSLLQEHGVQATRLDGGFTTWVARRGPTEVSP